jgi:hypothetical protein
MSADSASPSAGKSRTVPLIVLLVGGLILAYGLIILAPVVPTAAWSGVLDSVALGAPAGPQLPGRKTTTAMTLYLHGQTSGRTFSLPGASSLNAQSLKAGDTVRASVGWGTFREMPAVVNLVSAGSSLVDSSTVLRDERTQRSRIALVGGAVLLLGLAGMMRSARKK